MVKRKNQKQQDDDSGGLKKGPASMTEHMQHMCCNDEGADVYFICMDGKKKVRIPAHKYILSVRSAVMKSMFFGSLPEANDVEISDISAEVFRHMLKYIYFDCMDIQIALAPNLLYAARKYMLFHLVDKVVDFMTTHLKSPGSKTGSLLMLQNLMQCGEMESTAFKTCLKVIEEHAKTLLETDEFCQLREQTVKVIIQWDELRISEEALYRCLLKWSAQECKRQKMAESVRSHRIVLSQLIRHIRFTSFTADQLSKLMGECRVLYGYLIADLLVGCSNDEVKKSITFFDNKPARKEPIATKKVCRQCRHPYREDYPCFLNFPTTKYPCRCNCQNCGYMMV